jgi:erythronate-4-phosphate dehydrogenase
MKVVADDKIPFLKGVLEPLVDVVYLPGKAITNNDLKDADALITRTRTICNEKLLQGSSVKFIGTATIGYDHIDTEYCEKNGIFWTNAPGCNSSSVQQYIAATLVGLAEKFNFSLTDKTLGVIGVGNVGKKVVSLAELLGMRVYLNDPPRQDKEGTCGFISLDGIVRECDIITLHVPLTNEGIYKTHHLFDEKVLSRLKKDTILINTSRGEVVDNIALENALETNRIKAAVLDVWENEPNIKHSLLDKLTFGTSHIAGYSVEGKANGTAMIVQAFSKYFNLEYNDWVPDELPGSPENSLKVDAQGKSDTEVISYLIEQTYKLSFDDNQLRKAVHHFEELRGNYWLRREFKAYTVLLENGSIELKRKLERLGFKVLTKK